MFASEAIAHRHQHLKIAVFGGSSFSAINRSPTKAIVEQSQRLPFRQVGQ
jgi:hypothetical protein